MRRSRTLVLAAAVAMAAVGAPATAHDTGAIDPDNTTPVEYTKGDVRLVAHHYFPEASDMMFQTRSGEQILDGQVIDDTRDYLFVGGDAKNSTSYGAVQIFDVTDPAAPDHLAAIPCSGYHAEVGVYENLLFQGIDSASTNKGCEDPGTWDPRGADQPGKAGIRVYDVEDPANPTVLMFLNHPLLPAVHNFTINAEAGLIYLSFSGGGKLGIVDLESRDGQGNRTFEISQLDLADDIGVPGDQILGDCHDIGLNLERDLMACAASISGQTYIWDISDPRRPQQVSTIVYPEVVHHGARWAPDGVTLVLNDEHAGALDTGVDDPNDIGAGTNGCLGPNGAVGAISFWDTSDPTTPVPKGSFTPQRPEPWASPCTSHFYNFIPDSSKVVVGWYEGGIVVADFSLAPVVVEEAVFLPEYGNFWSAYAYHGFLYGASRTVAPGDEEYTDIQGQAAKGPGGGLWVVKLGGMEVAPPSPQDEGTSWVRWTDDGRLAGTDGVADGGGGPARLALMRADGWAWALLAA